MTSRVIQTGKPLRLGTSEEQAAAGAVQVGGTDTNSWLGVPITGADRVIGVLGLESVHEHAYTDADERLLSTLAASMGVALENARLFDETKRLLAETNARAAELAVVNEIRLRAGRAPRLPRDRRSRRRPIRRIFKARTIQIGVLDAATGAIDFPFDRRRGADPHGDVRVERGPVPIVVQTRSRSACGARRRRGWTVISTTAPQRSHGSAYRSAPVTVSSA